MAMTQRVITECDYPGHEDIHDEDDEIVTVKFGIDGTTYEIDLCAEKATELRNLLAGYVANGRKAKATTSTTTTAAPAGKPRGQAAQEAREKREYYNKVRDWANRQRTADDRPRFNVSDRGQIAYEIRDAYDRAMAEEQQPEQQQQHEQARQPEQQPPDYTGALPAELREPAFSGV